MSEPNLNGSGCLVMLVVMAVILIGVPFLLIWALNTLGVTHDTPFTFWTWLAAFVLVLFIGGSSQVEMKK